MKILIVMSGFFPGQKYGGPPVSVDNFCTLMKEHDCYIVTRNHDMGESTPYSNVTSGWNNRGNCKVQYLTDKEYGYKKYEDVIKEIHPDIIYLQGLFQYCVIPCLFLAKKYNTPVLLAPRGELCTGAFKKRYKKIPYIIFLKMFGLLKNVKFQSTSEEETDGIMKRLSVEKERIYFLSNIPSIPANKTFKTEKKSGEASFIFLSRIVPKKNLLSAINYMAEIKGKVQFDIYGALEDPAYWEECQKRISQLPDNIKVEYKGLVSHDQVHDTFRKYDAFLFPTLSENYGHVIAEAMSVGCPVIISDQVPWVDVEAHKAGWALPLEQPEMFIKAIQCIVDSDCNEETLLRENSIRYFDLKLQIIELRKTYQKALDSCI